MPKYMSYAVLCLAVVILACDESDSGESSPAAALELSQLSYTWQFVDSHFTVDSVVCGVTCFTSRAYLETLTIETDSSFSRMACTATGGRSVGSHSPSCSSAVVVSPVGSTNCELDTGRCSLTADSLCLAGGSAGACFAASLSQDGKVLTLVDTLGVGRSYVVASASPCP
jgi:hypothetical protein